MVQLFVRPRQYGFSRKENAYHLFSVRAKQPFNTDSTATRSDTSSRVNGALPQVMETVEVGEMCVFNKDNGWEIGRILQFAHHEKKKICANQYKGRVASTKNTDLGVLCTWFQESTGTYRMRGSEHHSYLPLARYVCTLMCQCFMHHNSFIALLVIKIFIGNSHHLMYKASIIFGHNEWLDSKTEKCTPATQG